MSEKISTTNESEVSNTTKIITGLAAAATIAGAGVAYEVASSDKDTATHAVEYIVPDVPTTDQLKLVDQSSSAQDPNNPYQELRIVDQKTGQFVQAHETNSITDLPSGESAFILDINDGNKSAVLVDGSRVEVSKDHIGHDVNQGGAAFADNIDTFHVPPQQNQANK